MLDKNKSSIDEQIIRKNQVRSNKEEVMMLNRKQHRKTNNYQIKIYSFLLISTLIRYLAFLSYQYFKLLF